MPAISGHFNPTQGSVTATTTPTDLFTLLSAVFSDLHRKCCFYQLQLDVAAGGTSLYVGNSNVSTTMYGTQLSAGSAFQTLAFDSNLIYLPHVYLLASTGTAQVNVIVVVR